MTIKTYLKKGDRTTFSIPELRLKIVVPNKMVVEEDTTQHTFLNTLANIYNKVEENPDNLNAGVGGVNIDDKPKFI